MQYAAVSVLILLRRTSFCRSVDVARVCERSDQCRRVQHGHRGSRVVLLLSSEAQWPSPAGSRHPSYAVPQLNHQDGLSAVKTRCVARGKPREEEG